MFKNSKSYISIFILIFTGCNTSSEPISPKKSQKIIQCPENNVSKDINRTKIKVIKKIKFIEKVVETEKIVEKKMDIESEKKILQKLQLKFSNVQKDILRIERAIRRVENQKDDNLQKLTEAQTRINRENISACRLIKGSTKLEVLAIMGKPTGHNWKGAETHRFSTEWYYGDKIVEFNHSGIIVTVGLCN